MTNNNINVKVKRTGSPTPSTEVKSEIDYKSFYDKGSVKIRLQEFGVNLLEWQEHVLRNSLAMNNGLHYRNIGLSVPRQNGKTEIIIARIFIGLMFLKDSMVYSSYREASSDQIFERLYELIESSPRKIKRYFPNLPSKKSKDKTIVAVHPESNKVLGKVRFMTRKGGGGRGMSEGVIFLDEAQDLTSGEMAAITAATATFTESQVWYVGTPEPAESAATMGTSSSSVSSVFKNIRKQIKSGLKFSYWAEWGVDSVNRDDKDGWYKSNPSLGHVLGETGRGITEEYLESRTVDDTTFAIEHLGFWSEQDKNSAIEITRWDDVLIDIEDIKDEYSKGDTYVAIKSSLDNSRIDIAVSVKNNKKSVSAVIVELLDSIDGDSDWMSVVSLHMDQWLSSNRVKGIIVDGDTASTGIKNYMIQKGKWSRNRNTNKSGKVTIARASDVSSACANFITAINSKNVYHSGQSVVDIAISDAGKRLFGRSSSAFGFESISGKTNASMVETLALAVSLSSASRVISGSNNNSNWNLKSVTNLKTFGS